MGCLIYSGGNCDSFTAPYIHSRECMSVERHSHNHLTIHKQAGKTTLKHIKTLSGIAYRQWTHVEKQTMFSRSCPGWIVRTSGFSLKNISTAKAGLLLRSVPWLFPVLHRNPAIFIISWGFWDSELESGWTCVLCQINWFSTLTAYHTHSKILDWKPSGVEGDLSRLLVGCLKGG